MRIEDQDAILHRALLMVDRGRLDEARKLIARVPPCADAESLCARIDAIESRQRRALDHLRQLRYQFHLDTSWRRAVAYLCAIAVTVDGLWQLGMAAPFALAHGLSAYLTTQVNLGGRYSDHWVDYTRPIYYDLIYGTVLVFAGLLATALILRVARGAADWEELNAADDDWRDRRWSRWW
jgi:hypothetical protein